MQTKPNHLFLYQSIEKYAIQRPQDIAICYKDKVLTYQQLSKACNDSAKILLQQGICKGDRVAIYLPKTIENVTYMLACMMLGAIFVPINPALKASQVAYVIRHSGSCLLISSHQRMKTLVTIEELKALKIIDTDNQPVVNLAQKQPIRADLYEADLVAILYTSGSTGLPKGVMISHKNLLRGAQIVSDYLNIQQNDHILAVLPFSFDYGLNQLTSALYKGAQCILLDYLLPQDVVKACLKYQVTGLAAVPPLWPALTRLNWPHEARHCLRYFSNSGGVLSQNTLKQLREIFPQALPYLMYGLTEAFRSTYLPPELIDVKPNSMGKAVDGETILVLDEAGQICPPGECGELVHLGDLVSQGYWQDPDKTNKRFKAVHCANQQIGVWSGDKVKRDEDGFLYFVSRMDEMIKSSGYRISPYEIESVLQNMQGLNEVCVFGEPHPVLGDGIVLVFSSLEPNIDLKEVKSYSQSNLANFMVPHHIEFLDIMPKNTNGKIDRAGLKRQFASIFN